MKLKIDGRISPIINPNTNLAMVLEAQYGRKHYELFNITVSATEKEPIDWEDFSLSCPSVKYNAKFVAEAINTAPSVGICFHFKEEESNEGIILLTELTRRRNTALVIGGYEGSKQVPKVKGTLEYNQIIISESADKAISSLPDLLK